jgi:dienelactone hydrolase
MKIKERCVKRILCVVLLFSLIGIAVRQSTSAQKQAAADQWLTRPVDNKTFETFLDFFTYDKRLPFELHSIDVVEQEGIRKEHLSFQSTPSVRVFANLYQSAGAAKAKRPAIILLHGGSPAGKDSPPAKVMAELLTRGGWDVLAIDMPYFGERGTGLLTTFTEEEKHERLYNQQAVYLDWVTQIVKDVGRSFDLLVEQREADPKRIGLIGISRGAIIAAVVGGAERRLSAVAMLNGGHFDALERGHLPAACPANYIGRISPRPLLMINGTRDTDMIKDTSVLPVYRLAKKPKLILWADTGHQLPTEELRAELLKWLRENLK